MAGVVLETLSNRKLFAFGAVLLLVQIGFFLIGGLVGKFGSLTLVAVNNEGKSAKSHDHLLANFRFRLH